jgi:hypothetical protein
MNSIIYSASDCMKGHLSLKRYNALYFISIIVDEKAEHKTEDVVMSICQKFDIPYSENYSIIEGQLFSFLQKSHDIVEKTESYWKTKIEGIVEILYTYVEYTYVSSDGKDYRYRCYELSSLIVNENKVEEDDWNQKKVDSFIDDIETLFSIKQSDVKDHHDVFEMAWERFEKGDKWKTRDQMQHASLLMCDERPDDFTKDYYDALLNGCLFITKKWFLYLWECKEKNTPEDYIMSLKTFISKNQDSWATNKHDHVIHNKIYTNEHEEIRKSFAREQIILYKSLWD